MRGESRSVRGLPDQARDGDRGACTDYDCAGGSGNGPEYVPGPVRVVGPDDYELDADGDGVGCED